MDKVPFDENIVCPLSGAPLIRDGDALVSTTGEHRYVIAELFVPQTDELLVEADATTKTVQEFYTQAPFPDYNEFDNLSSFKTRAKQGLFARILQEQVPMNSRVLEVGCGTAQLSNYLAATSMSEFYAADMTSNSLKLGIDFAQKNGISGIKFLQMNLFHPCIKPQSMDVVLCNGVLHHTEDAKAAFNSIAPLVRPGGHIIIGLYNKIGRLRTDIRRRAGGSACRLSWVPRPTPKCFRPTGCIGCHARGLSWAGI